MRRVLWSWGFLFLLAPCFAGTITGHVFVDLNGDNLWQATDKPCAGALVSDGHTVVAAGADGSYTVQSPDGPQVISVENPAQTWPTQGFSRYLPEGRGTADFPLKAQEQKLPFVFVQGTDLHTRPDVGDKMAQYLSAINTLPLPVAFVVHTGDLVVDSGGSTVPEARKLFAVYQQQVAALKMPLFNLPGNHEHVSWYRNTFDPNEFGTGKSLYREVFGPMEYSFNYAGVHFVALDGTDWVNNQLAYSMPADCVNWLKAYLAQVPAGDRLVLLCHEPLFTLPQKAELEQILSGRKVVLSLSGHWHTVTRSSFAGAPEIVGGATSYSWHGAPTAFDAIAYNVVRITDTGFENAFGDWAERYSVTMPNPGLYARLKDQVPVKVQFLDPANEVQSARLQLGTASQEVTSFTTEGLQRVATGTLDASALTDGYHDMLITLRGKGEPMVEKQPRLVLTGQEAAFAATGPAMLKMRLTKVNAANLIKVNGETVGTTPLGTAANQDVTFPVPAALLKQCNTIELISVPLADGKTYDDFVAGPIYLEYADKKYFDPRSRGGATATISNTTQSTIWPCWVDLGYPQP